MKNVISCIVCAAMLACVGCASVTRGKVGPGQLVVRTEAHEWRGVAVNTKNGERSVTIGVVTVGGDASLEPATPNVFDLGFTVTVPGGRPETN